MLNRALENVLKQIEEISGRAYIPGRAEQAGVILNGLIERTADPIISEMKILKTLKDVARATQSSPQAIRTTIQRTDVLELGTRALNRAKTEYRGQFAESTIPPDKADRIVREAYLEGKFGDSARNQAGYKNGGINGLSFGNSGTSDPSNKATRFGFT